MSMIKSLSPRLSLAGSILGLVFAAMPSSAAITSPAISLSVAGYGSLTVDSLANYTYTGSCDGITTCLGTLDRPGVGVNNLVTGQLRWTGTIQNFTGSITATSSHNPLLPQLDLLTSGLGNGVGGTIVVSVTDVNFTLGANPSILNVIGGGTGSQAFQGYFDLSNTPFLTTTQALATPLTGIGTGTGNGPGGPLFSMTDVATLTMPAGTGVTLPPDSFDFLFNDAVEPLKVDCSALAAGTVGTAYNGNVIATGGIQPYSFTVSGGSLTPLSLDILSGAITGTPTVAGNLNFTAQVVDSSGNSASNTASSACTIVVSTPHTTPPPPIGKNDTATIGFWHNKNGQGVILALNGGPSSTALGNWLATSFPYLYGVHSSNNLTGKTNSTVAGLFMTFFGAGGQKTQAQILAGALASYVTSSTLTGSTKSVGFGFNNSPGGTGGHSINVGSEGTVIGLLNNTSYTVTQLLNQVNLDIQNGTYAAAANAFNDIFNNINQGGDIS